MKVINSADYITMPWKNGRGVTHEIARRDERWRLSLAEVDVDSPFSLFPGRSRILTVISGNGMRLATSDGTLMAKPLTPLAFSGDLAIDGYCTDGPVRNLNMIHDSRCTDCNALYLDGPSALPDVRGTACEFALYCIQGQITLADHAVLDAGATALVTQLQSAPAFSADASALLISIKDLGHRP